jgi:flagellar hook assembly protein FlgD
VSPTYSDKTVVFEIKALYPNPFRDKGTLYYTLGHEAQMEMTIYNVAGEPLWKFDLPGKAGNNTIDWDGKNDLGARVASGIYVIRLKATGSEGSEGVVRWATACVAR